MFGKRAVELLREVVNVLPEHLPAYNVSHTAPSPKTPDKTTQFMVLTQGGGEGKHSISESRQHQ